jgi:hypothetical protein
MPGVSGQDSLGRDRPMTSAMTTVDLIKSEPGATGDVCLTAAGGTVVLTVLTQNGQPFDPGVGAEDAGSRWFVAAGAMSNNCK